MNTGELEIVTISVIKQKKIVKRFVVSSMLLMLIGAITMTYSETILFNSYIVGFIQVVAGMISLLTVIGVFKNRTLSSNIISISLIFRAVSYVVEMFSIGFRPSLLNGVIIWLTIWMGFMAVDRSVQKIEELQSQAEKWAAIRTENHEAVDQATELRHEQNLPPSP